MQGFKSSCHNSVTFQAHHPSKTSLLMRLYIANSTHSRTKQMARQPFDYNPIRKRDSSIEIDRQVTLPQ